MTPALIALVLATSLLAILPTRRLAERTTDRWLVAAYYLALWLLLLAAILVPGARRIAIPVILVLAIAPWVTLRAGIDRLLGRRSPTRPAAPRNVTPPDAGAPRDR